jgi:predicted double-glycine peptidase
LDLKRFVDGRGYEGTGYGRLTLRRLSELAPAIVPVNFNGYNHFVVFRGVVGKHVLLADPAFGNRIVSVGRFERAWLDYSEFGHVGFTVTRRDSAAPPNQLAPDPAGLIFVPDAVLRTALPFAPRS